MQKYGPKPSGRKGPEQKKGPSAHEHSHAHAQGTGKPKAQHQHAPKALHMQHAPQQKAQRTQQAEHHSKHGGPVPPVTPKPTRDQFMPVSKADMKARGWDQCDFVFVIGDAYVDHPSFAPAIISRVLEEHGYRVGIIPQPDWHDPASVTIL